VCVCVCWCVCVCVCVCFKEVRCGRGVVQMGMEGREKYGD
jgi:hypothetical protein